MKKFFRRIQYNWDLILLAYIAWIIMPVTMLGMVYLILATLKIGWLLREWVVLEWQKDYRSYGLYIYSFMLRHFD